MKLARSLMGVVFLLSTSAAIAGNQCPAVDCDCSAFNEPSWRILCEVNESKVKAECASNGGQPLSYCRLHGPESKPVALSVKASDLPRLPDGAKEEQMIAKVEQINTTIWSLVHDFKAATNYQKEGKLELVYQTLKIVEGNAEKLFYLEREAVEEHKIKNKKQEAKKLALSYDKGWRDLANNMEKLSEIMIQQKVDAKNNAKNRQIANKIARVAATVEEYSGHILAEAELNESAARAWQLSASIAEQLVYRSIADRSSEKYVNFYREQAAARWHRAAYYWLASENKEESQLSFQNASLVLEESAVEGVAGATR